MSSKQAPPAAPSKQAQPAAASKHGPSGPAKQAATDSDAAGTQLEQELRALKGELAAARARITELEQSRAQVVNRIDWIIDSLHNIRDRQA